MKNVVATFEIEVEDVKGLCPAGENYAEQQRQAGRIPVLSCEGPCIRGEIARQAARVIGKHPRFARACQGEAVAVPHSAMARWVREAPQVLVLDGCFLHCQARLTKTELKEVAGQVAARVVAAFPDAGGAAVSEGVARRDVTAPQP